MKNQEAMTTMNRIESFTIDHVRLKKGVYVSRVDHVGSEVLTTFDLRMKKPNAETLSNPAIHTLEHLVATYLRNDETYKSRIIYFGPMGCLTGMYLIVHGSYTSEEILPLIIRAFEFVATYEGEIPGATEVECGTYRLHSLKEAKAEAVSYLEVLKQAGPENLNYPE
jgi:S-ribosylhomocysteine lyase